MENNDEYPRNPMGIWYTTKDVSTGLKVNVRSPQRWIRTGELKASWFGGGYRISEEDLKRFLQKRKGFRSKRGPMAGKGKQNEASPVSPKSTGSHTEKGSK